MRSRPAPIAAALLLAAALLPSAAGAKSCLGKDPEGADDPATLDALRACQARERKAFIKAEQAGTGKAPGEAALEKLDDGQRAEATTYLSRHTVDGGETAAADEQAPGARAARRPRPTFAAGLGAPDGSVEREAHADPAEIDALKAEMVEKSEGGKKGITPEMAADLRKYLMSKQGSVSPEMQDLLDSTARDGANLTTGTMKKLRGAGKDAKAQGLDLGIDPAVEKQLLEGDLEPAPGAPRPGTN